MNLEGKIAIVTGSGMGIGRATAIALSNYGAIPVVADINFDAAHETAEHIRRQGHECFEIEVDITDDKQTQKMADSVVERYEKIDILVNNVGASAPPVPINELSNEIWDTQFKVSVKSVFFCTRAIVGIMKKRKQGRIINIASIAGRSFSLFAGVPYAAAKHAVVGFTRQLARELAPYFILVNCVAPGVIETERVRKRMELQTKAREQLIAMTALSRPGRPEEIAGAVVFLASDLSSYMTGATIDVNGGMFML